MESGDFCLFCNYKMAVHFTENKGNANGSAVKTPFLIEDILDRNSIKAGNKMNFKNHSENSSHQGGRNGSEIPANNHNEKNIRNNNEIQPDEEEYRKLLQSERYAKWQYFSSLLFCETIFENI